MIGYGKGTKAMAHLICFFLLGLCAVIPQAGVADEIGDAIEARTEFELDNPWDRDSCSEYIEQNLESYNQTWADEKQPEMQRSVTATFAGSIEEGGKETWLMKLYAGADYTFLAYAKPSATSPPTTLFIDIVDADPSAVDIIRGGSGSLDSLKVKSTTQATVTILMKVCGGPDLRYRECSFCVGMLDKTY